MLAQNIMVIPLTHKLGSLIHFPLKKQTEGLYLVVIVFHFSLIFRVLRILIIPLIVL